MRVHPRHRIDLSAADLALAACACAVPARRRNLAAGVERAWSPSGGALACLSVRSGLDLLLSALDLPLGSEVLVSAITIPDMVRIIQGHGLVPVPVDVEPSTLAPRTDLAEQLVTDRTRAVLVAHLFGGHVDLAPLAALARRHHLLVIEDCAQAFAGPGDTGNDLADVSLFSFGPIKTATALGGALVRVRNAQLLDRMGGIHATWPVQRRSAYARRIIRFSALARFSTRSPTAWWRRSPSALGARWTTWSVVSPEPFPAPSTSAANQALPCCACSATVCATSTSTGWRSG